MTVALEDVKTIEIDKWFGLNTAASPTRLEKGESPNMENVWVDEKPGSVITANGFLRVGVTPSGRPMTFCIDYFKTSSGSQLFVLSDNSNIWSTLDFQNFTLLASALSSAFQLRGAVIRDKLWLTNGSDEVLVFDGTTTVALAYVPRGRYIAFHDERVWMYHFPSDRSSVRFTALVDNAGAIIEPDSGATAWPGDNEIQIAEGDADFGTGLILYRGYLYAFKQYGIYRIVGYDEYTYTRVKTRASTGSRFNESLQIKDNLVHLIGIDGIYVFDGEDAERISDIIDPASASQTAFGFDEIQQPNTNNQFFEVTDTAEWNTGTFPRNLAIDSGIRLQAEDDSKANFDAGATLTNIDTVSNPGAIQLTTAPTGSSSLNVASGKTGSLPSLNGGTISGVGSVAMMTDGNTTNSVGYHNINTALVTLLYSIDLGGSISIGSVTVKSFGMQQLSSAVVLNAFNGGIVYVEALIGGVWTQVGTFSPVIASPNIGGTGFFTYPLIDYSVSFGVVTATQVRLRMEVLRGNYLLTEFEIFRAGYDSPGKFVSGTLDYTLIPSAYGSFYASYTLPANQGLNFFTQSSADGSTWDVETAVASGSSIASTVRRYLRWGANFTSNAVDTPVITNVFLPAVYISAVHNTGGSIFAWGPFEADYASAGQTVRFFYRTATLLASVSAAAWNQIVPGGVISDPVANQYIQFKIEISGGTPTSTPSVSSITINWISGTGTQPSTLQNVASYFWRNRYWLSAAGAGATSNNLVLVRGKKTKEFDSPWQLKDWNILSFARFHDSLYGGSSVDGSIYKLDVGYSKNGASLDSFFETGDFTFGGFDVSLYEILVEVDRLGPYTLSVGVSKDQGVTWTEKTVDLTIATRISFFKKLNFDIMSDILRFRLRINAADQPFQVHRMTAFYKYMATRGSIN